MTILRRHARLLAAALSACALLHAPASAQERYTGLVFATPTERARIPLAAIPFGSAALPAEVDWSHNFPAPGQQGNQNSCVGWATAYLKTYLERVEARYSGEPAPPMFSPAFIYNQINRGLDAGANIPDALRMLSNSGAVTILDMPYREGDHRAQPSPQVRAGARRYRIDSYRQVNVDDVKEVQSHVAAGFPVIIGAAVDEGFGRLGAGEVWRSRIGAPRGGHAMVIVGYSEARGAFKVINSWGRSWGDQGYGWIGFAHFRDVVREGYVARDATNEAPSRPEPQPVPRPVPVPTPTPTPTPLPEPVPTPLRPYEYVTSTASDAPLGIFAVNVPAPLLEELRTRIREGHAVTSVAVTSWGGWVLGFGNNGFTRSQLPRDLDSTLTAINRRQETIRRIAISPSGAWIVLHGNRGGWTANGLTQADYAAMRQLSNAGESIPDAAFLSDGTLLLVRGHNGWWSNRGLPPQLLQALQAMNQAREEIRGVSSGPDLSWLLVRGANGNWATGAPQRLIDYMNIINRARGTINYATVLPNGGWILLQKM